MEFCNPLLLAVVIAAGCAALAAWNHTGALEDLATRLLARKCALEAYREARAEYLRMASEKHAPENN